MQAVNDILCYDLIREKEVRLTGTSIDQNVHFLFDQEIKHYETRLEDVLFEKREGLEFEQITDSNEIRFNTVVYLKGEKAYYNMPIRRQGMAPGGYRFKEKTEDYDKYMERLRAYFIAGRLYRCKTVKTTTEVATPQQQLTLFQHD